MQRVQAPATMSPIELSCDYDSLNSMIQRIAMFSPKEADQAFFRGSFLPLGSKNQPVCVADDVGSATLWDNFQVIEGGNEIFVYSGARCR